MINKIITLSLITLIAKQSISQTYTYDKNLRVSQNIIKEATFTKTYDIYTAQEINDEFEANPIRAEYKFKNSLIIIKGEIAKIYKIRNTNYITFDVSNNQYIKKYLYVPIYDTNLFKDTHTFDKITNYSVGDWIGIISLYHESDIYGHRFFVGNILHTKNITNPKKNCFIKINNVPDNTSVSFEHDNSSWNTKFSQVNNNKTFCKVFTTNEYTTLKVTFKNNNGDAIKQAKLKAKINCVSSFDYNKL